MKDHATCRHAACLIVAVTVLSFIPAAFAAKTPRVSGTLGTGGYGVVDDTPYYGGFGAGFLHINGDGTYGGGEIRSGDLDLRFYGPTFGGPYRFQLHVQHAKGEWNGDLVAGGASGMQVGYLPLFPKCQYTFKHEAMPLDVKMEAFAPWIPGDSKMSSLPVLFFDFQITNPDASEKTVSLACMVPNPECDGGSPVMEKGGQVNGILLQSKRAGGGTLCGMIRNDGVGQVTWGADFTKGKLSGTNGNLLASSIVVPGKSTRRIVFILAWDFPVYVSGDGKAWARKELGHYHSNFYQGADAIARDCQLRYPAIRTGVDAWFRRMWDESNLPEWMRKQILISTSHMAYNGVFFKNGQAALKEGDCFQLVGTYDEQFHPSICELIFLPEAEWGNLQIFAEILTPDGAIRHDLGEMCVTATSTSVDHGGFFHVKRGERKDRFSGIDFSKDKETVSAAFAKAGSFDWWDAGDNTPEWILDLYRDYLWTGDVARLKALWPTVRTCCAYMLGGDRDNNGLYDDPKTYDCFHPVPENMYINDLQRAAFQAAAKIASIAGDTAAHDAYLARSEQMAKAIEGLWNPKGFYSMGRSRPDCLISSGLYGEHSDDLLGLPSQLSRERVKQHLKYMFAHHYNGKTFAVSPDLTYPVMANAEGLRDFSALALWRGITDEAMTVVKCFYDVIFTHLQREWNQPMLINPDLNPSFGNHYQSVPGAWHVLLGLEGVRWDVPRKKLSLRPNLPASFKGKLSTFLPGAVTWGGLDYSCVEPDCDQKFVLTFERPFELEFLGVRNSGKPTVRATQGGKAVPCSIKVVNADEYEVQFAKPLHLDGKPLEVRIGSK
jgi:uncharacterized protein (DUF608 family)